ncbi:VENN motif pre-toxin domain-containing protein, partial [Martelella alba]
LSSQQKESVSALSTLTSGIAAGVSGDSRASALTGAQAGKNAVENNSLGGAAGSGLGMWLGEIPDAGIEEKAQLAGDIAEGNAKVSAGIANAAGVVMLPVAGQAMWGLGAAANAGVRYLDGKPVDPVSATVAGWVNVASMGSGLAGTIGWNAAGGALTSSINGEDPLTGAITNSAGSALGYGFGKIIAIGANAVGKYITQGFDPKFHPNLLKYTEIKGQLGISKEMLPSKIPSSAGNMGASYMSEKSSNIIENQRINKAGQNNEVTD